MAKKNRNTLKTYFQTGKKPTEAQFADLIDSFVNRLEDDFESIMENKVDKTGSKMSGDLTLNNAKLSIENLKSNHDSIKSITDIHNKYNFARDTNYLILKHKIGVTNCYINIFGGIILYGNRGRVNFEIGCFYSSTAISSRDIVFVENSSEIDFSFQKSTDNDGNLLIIIKKDSASELGSYGNFFIDRVNYSMQGSSSDTWNDSWVLGSAININELNLNTNIVEIPQDYRRVLKLKSPNSKIWKIKIDNNGNLYTI